MATIDRIDLYTLNSNSPLNHIIYPVVKKFDANKHRILLRVENIIYDVLDNNSSKKIYLPMDPKKGFQNALSFSKPELKTVTIYAQLYDFQKDVILDTKKQAFTEAPFFKIYNKTGVITSTLANTFSTYWNKTRRVEKVEGPFTTAECTTLATDIKTDVKYYFAATPKQYLNPTELVLMKWQYRYDDGEFTDFNYAIETQNGLKNVMSCTFHKNPSKIQVYAFFKKPSNDVSIALNVSNSQNTETQNQNTGNEASENQETQNSGQAIKITEELLDLFMSKTGHGSINKKSPYNRRIPSYIEYLNLYMQKFGLNENNLRKAHFLGQIAKETKFWSYKEDFIYKKSALPKTFKNFNSSEGLQKANLLGYETNKNAVTKSMQIQVANYAYATGAKAGELGNTTCPENKLSDPLQDGYNYRGRGLIQITGKSHYKHFQKWYDEKREILQLEEINFVENPDKTLDPKIVVLSAIYFWDSNKLNELADKGIEKSHILAISNIINGNEDNTKKVIRRDYVLAAYDVLKATATETSRSQVTSGTWHEPVDNPICTLHTQNGYGGKGTEGEYWGLFGNTRNGGPHQGLDLFAKPGSNIYACVKSEVHEIARYNGYGNTITLKVLDKEAFLAHRRDYVVDYSAKGEIVQGEGFDKTNDIYLFYGHLSNVLVEKKDPNGNPTVVDSGKVIAESGVSGIKNNGTCAPHLHFEIFTSPTAIGKGLKYRCNPGFYVHFKKANEQNNDDIDKQKKTAQAGRIKE